MTMTDAEKRQSVKGVPPRISEEGLPARRRTAISPHWIGPLALSATSVAAIVLYVVQLDRVDLDAMNGMGLISVLPMTTLAGPALLLVAFIAALSSKRQRRWLLCIQLIVLTLMLHGITVLLESEPRFAISWVHAGFVEYIGRTGTTLPGLDTRWSWPGFFALAAFLFGKGDLNTLHPVLAVTPVVFNLAYLLALGVLLSTLRMSWQAKWLAAVFFCLLNWVGQDYFSPQGFSLLLYLLFVAFLALWFGVRAPARPSTLRPLRWGRSLWRWIWRDTSPGELPPRDADPAPLTVILLVIVGLFAAATVSHQLTPFAMLLALIGLVIARRCSLTGLPVLLCVLLVAWISYMTQAFWAGHFGAVMSGVGNVGGTLSSNISDRAKLGGADHQLVVRLRMVSTLLVFGVAFLGLVRRRRRRIEDRVLLVLVGAPVGMAFMQSYGGEMALRVYLFALAPACALAAVAFFPDAKSRPSVVARCAAGVFALIMLFSFFITRYGNEAFERMNSGAVSALQTVYDNTSSNVKFLYASAVPELDSTPFMPLGFRDVERVSWTNTLAPPNPTNVGELLDTLRGLGPSGYLITTRSQEAYIEYGQGYPLDWGDRFRRAVAGTPGVRVIAQNPDAAIYALDWPPGAVPNRTPPVPTGVDIWRTPWTPIGVAFLIVLVGLLLVREVWRIRLAPEEFSKLRPLTMAAMPFLVGFIAVVIERFVLLT